MTWMRRLENRAEMAVARARTRWPHRNLTRVAALAVLLLAASCLVHAPPVAYADGGAPVAAYVTGGGPDAGDLVVLDIARSRVAGRVHLGGDPDAVALSVDGSYAYVAEPSAGQVAVVDVFTLAVTQSLAVGGQPAALAIDTAVTSDLFVADRASSRVTVIDPRTLKVVARIPVGLHPAGLALAGQSSGIADWNNPEMYVANTDGDKVSVISTRDLRVVATIPVPGGPERVVVPATGGVAYVGTRAGAIVALSLLDHRILGTLTHLHGSAVAWMDYNAVTGEICVPDSAADAVDILAPVSLSGTGSGALLPAEPVRAHPLAGAPSAVAVTSDGAYALVTQSARGSVTILDGALRQTLATIAVGGHPREVVTGPNLPVTSPADPTTTQPSARQSGVVDALRYTLLGALLLGILVYLLWRFGMRGRMKVRR